MRCDGAISNIGAKTLVRFARCYAPLLQKLLRVSVDGECLWGNWYVVIEKYLEWFSDGGEAHHTNGSYLDYVNRGVKPVGFCVQ